MTALQYEELYDMEASALGGQFLLAQYVFGPGMAAGRAEEVGQAARAIVPQLMVLAGAEARQAFAGLRLTPAHVEAFFHVGQAEHAARVVLACAVHWPRLPAPRLARRVPSSRTWISIAPHAGDFGTLAPDGPTLEEIERRIAAIDAHSEKLAQLRRHFDCVKARHEQIKEEHSIALRDPLSTLAAQAWVAEQLEALALALSALTRALPK
jgi:hypothetical protein